LAPSPIAASGFVEPVAADLNFAGHRTHDSIFFPTVHLFLVYGVMLV